MVLLAPKLPYTHPYAAGYSSCVGYQPVPTDPDAIDYLGRVAAADGGVGVEVGVAMAVDSLVRGCKEDGLWDAIKASCLLCGPRTLSGALVPLVGTAPTSYAFASGDYNRVTGLKGDGSTTYLDSGRASTADGLNDFHVAAYATAGATGAHYFIGAQHAAVSYKMVGYAVWSRSATSAASGTPSSHGLYAVSRSSGSAIEYIKPPSGVTTASVASVAGAGYATNDYVFGYANSAGVSSSMTDARLAFYSIGSSLDLAALDTHVSRYVAAVQFWHNTGLAATGYDDATIDYINRAYANGGTL